MERTPLRLNPDELSACVSCGLCLPTCPTYRVTGSESASPRGRIALMRSIESGAIPLDTATARFFDECVQCRACDVACPSGVQFGRLIQDTKVALTNTLPHRRPLITRVSTRVGLGVLSRPVMLRTFGVAAVVARRLIPKRFGVPQVSLRHMTRALVTSPLHPDSAQCETVVMLTGCVMDVWQRQVHQDAIDVLEAAGVHVVLSGSLAPCCGALHHHAGDHEAAVQRAEFTIAGLSFTDAAVLVNSAGCGAAMKEYGDLLDTDDARRFSARVFDVHEWLAARPQLVKRLHLRSMSASVVVQDPCHLRNVQRQTVGVRALLGEVYMLIETVDDALCCGAGGAYSALEPTLSLAIRDRKVAALAAAAASATVLPADSSVTVASANPGCMMHLAAGGVTVAHPMSLLRAAMGSPVLPVNDLALAASDPALTANDRKAATVSPAADRPGPTHRTRSRVVGVLVVASAVVWVAKQPTTTPPSSSPAGSQITSMTIALPRSSAVFEPSVANSAANTGFSYAGVGPYVPDGMWPNYALTRYVLVHPPTGRSWRNSSLLPTPRPLEVAWLLRYEERASHNTFTVEAFPLQLREIIEQALAQQTGAQPSAPADNPLNASVFTNSVENVVLWFGVDGTPLAVRSSRSVDEVMAFARRLIAEPIYQFTLQERFVEPGYATGT